MTIEAIIFDKDGTLFEFRATWDAWAHQMLRHYAGGDQTLLGRLAGVLGFDLAAGQFHDASPCIAGTAREAAELIVTVLPGRAVDEVEEHLITSSMTAPLVEAVPLAPYLAGLSARGLKLGVVTNDGEAGALAHLDAVGVRGQFDFIAGFDSGYGAKPDPGPLLAFADALSVDPARVAMVGDSLHDLAAGRAAGMATLGVLTGPATRAELAPMADAVLDHIGGIPDWLDGRG